MLSLFRHPIRSAWISRDFDISPAGAPSGQRLHSQVPDAPFPSPRSCFLIPGGLQCPGCIRQCFRPGASPCALVGSSPVAAFPRRCPRASCISHRNGCRLRHRIPKRAPRHPKTSSIIANPIIRTTRARKMAPCPIPPSAKPINQSQSHMAPPCVGPCDTSNRTSKKKCSPSPSSRVGSKSRIQLSAVPTIRPVYSPNTKSRSQDQRQKQRRTRRWKISQLRAVGEILLHQGNRVNRGTAML